MAVKRREGSRANTGALHVVLFTCGHYRHFQRTDLPQGGDLLYCVRCNHGRRVVLAEAEYHVRCRDCRYGRRCGASLESGRSAAAAHVRFRHHVVDVLRGGKRVTTCGDNAVRYDSLGTVKAGQLELDVDPAPF